MGRASKRNREEECNLMIIELAKTLESEYGIDQTDVIEALAEFVNGLIEHHWEAEAYRHAMDND